MIRAGLAFGLIGLVLLGFYLAPQPGVQAGLVDPPLWQDDDYPPPQDTFIPTDAGYPPPEETTVPPDGEYPPPEGEATQEPTLTPSLPPTQAPADETPIFELGTATPSPTVSPTATSTVVPQVSPEAAQEDEPERFQVDWGFFWIGFAIPILAGSGVVLYLLDRRPDLFRPRSKP